MTDYKLPDKAYLGTHESVNGCQVDLYGYTEAQMQQAYQAGRDSMKAEAVKAVHNCLNDYVFTAEMAGHAGRHLQLAENAIKELK